MWCSVGSRFLQKNGITPPENIDSQMITRTLEESAAIFHETYGISGTVPEIVGRIIDMVRETITAIICSANPVSGKSSGSFTAKAFLFTSPPPPTGI